MMHDRAAGTAPPLSPRGIELVVPKGPDTDAFRTLTGERPRKGTRLDAARAKARVAIARRQVRLRPGLRDYADGGNGSIAKGG
jgi:hypothetical protein